MGWYLLVGLVILFRIELFKAVGTDGMAELDSGVIGNIGLQPVPGLFVVPYFMAMHADGQDTLKCLDVIHGSLYELF